MALSRSCLGDWELLNLGWDEGATGPGSARRRAITGHNADRSERMVTGRRAGRRAHGCG